jgi:hypothetical protein
MAAAVLLAGAWATTPAQAMCGTVQTLMLPIEFGDGSSAVAPGLAERARAFAAAHGESGTALNSLAVTVMGDLGEGAEFDAATAEARTADRALAEARLAAIRGALADLAKPITDVKLRPTRQLFSAEDRARNPMLTVRVRAGLFLTMMAWQPVAKPGQPLPTC